METLTLFDDSVGQLYPGVQSIEEGIRFYRRPLIDELIQLAKDTDYVVVDRSDYDAYSRLIITIAQRAISKASLVQSDMGKTEILEKAVIDIIDLDSNPTDDVPPHKLQDVSDIDGYDKKLVRLRQLAAEAGHLLAHPNVIYSTHTVVLEIAGGTIASSDDYEVRERVAYLLWGLNEIIDECNNQGFQGNPLIR